jgi:hypothetical protein
MENSSAETVEDPRDKMLLEKMGGMMGAMIEKMGTALEEKLRVMLNEKFDEKFAILDPLFVAIQESFLAVDERFKVMDGKISNLQVSMIDVQEKVTVLTKDVGTIKETLNLHTNALDGLSRKMLKWDNEFSIMSHVVTGIDKWVTQAAPIVGVSYVREQKTADYPGVGGDLPS